MCDLTQFLISSITINTKVESLAKLFMEEVMLSFGMVSVVLLDTDSRFRCVFEAMFKFLQIILWLLARGNHKVNSAKTYHRFLNKTQAIEGQDDDGRDVFIQNAKTSQYTWNSSPIYGSDMMYIVASVDREFIFPIDTELLPTPTLDPYKNQALFNHL